MWVILIVLAGLGAFAALIMYACLVVGARYNEDAEHQREQDRETDSSSSHS